MAENTRKRTCVLGNIKNHCCCFYLAKYMDNTVLVWHSTCGLRFRSNADRTRPLCLHTGKPEPWPRSGMIVHCVLCWASRETTMIRIWDPNPADPFLMRAPMKCQGGNYQAYLKLNILDKWLILPDYITLKFMFHMTVSGGPYNTIHIFKKWRKLICIQINKHIRVCLQNTGATKTVSFSKTIVRSPRVVSSF